MTVETIAWDNLLQLKDDGYDLVYLMVPGEEQTAWDEWMDSFSGELKAIHSAISRQQLELEKQHKKISAYLFTAQRDLKKMERLFTAKESNDNLANEIKAGFKCINDSINKALSSVEQGGKQHETRQNTLRGADGASAAEQGQAGFHRSGAGVSSRS